MELEDDPLVDSAADTVMDVIPPRGPLPAIHPRKAFEQLGEDLSLDPELLYDHATEDQWGGYHSDPLLARFPMGGTWAIEGQVLYTLVRMLKPLHVVEIGCERGISAIHILAALERNERGRLTSIDITGCGDLIPKKLRGRWTQLHGRGQDLLPTLEPAQMIFEDAAHTTEDVASILEAVKKMEPPPRIVISHDAEHFIIGPDVRAGYELAFGDAYKTMLIEPSDCGFAYHVPGVHRREQPP